jgi:hypothetical protein
MPQIIARFQFKPDRAHEFCFDGVQFTEMRFDTVEEVTALVEEFGSALVDVTAITNGRVVTLMSQPLS